MNEMPDKRHETNEPRKKTGPTVCANLPWVYPKFSTDTGAVAGADATGAVAAANRGGGI